LGNAPSRCALFFGKIAEKCFGGGAEWLACRP
jgi:hypothetical protein